MLMEGDRKGVWGSDQTLQKKKVATLQKIVTIPGFAKVLTHFYTLSSGVYNFFLKGQIKQPL